MLLTTSLDDTGGLTLDRIERKAPRLVLADPKPAINLGALRYSILPARCVQDPRINGRPHLLLLLAALCLHSDPQGRCYPSQARLAKLCGRSPPWVSRYIRDLERFGYVVRVKSRSKNWKHAIRRIVVYEPGAPLPKDEIPEPMPWVYPFSENQPIAERKENDMRMSTEQKATIEAKRLEQEAKIRAEQAAWNVADYFANRYATLFETITPSAISYDVAVRWLKLVDVKTAREHIDRLLTTSKLKNPDLLPSPRLSDYPDPNPERSANA